MNKEEQLKAGVTPGMIRVSVGIEHIDDILADIEQALCATGITSSRPVADLVV